MKLDALMNAIRIDLPACDWNDLIYKYNDFIDYVANNDFLLTRELVIKPGIAGSSFNIGFGSSIDEGYFIVRVLELYFNDIKYSDCFSWEEYIKNIQLYRYYVTSAVDKTIFISPNISATDSIKLICSVGYEKLTLAESPASISLTISDELIPLCKLYIIRALLEMPKYSSKDVTESLYIRTDKNYQTLYNRLRQPVHTLKKIFPFNAVMRQL